MKLMKDNEKLNELREEALFVEEIVNRKFYKTFMYHDERGCVICDDMQLSDLYFIQGNDGVWTVIKDNIEQVCLGFGVIVKILDNTNTFMKGV